MSIDARTEKFEHIELFGRPALFTNGRVNRDTVPECWYCYDFRGSDSDPGKLNCVELHGGVNHSGAVLLPEEIDMKGKGYRRVRGQINFLGEYLTIREFCKMHGLECTVKEPQFHIRPARPDEAGIFYALLPEQDERLGCIGHVRMDFGKSGNEFWHTWWPRGAEELNSPEFKSELQEVVDELRLTVLKNRSAMERFCYEHGGKIDGGYVQNYGYIVETEHYRYCLRCTPSPGDYNAYLTAFDLDVQRQNMAQKSLVGRVTFANDDTQEFTDAREYLQCLREELPYHATTGFRHETLTDDPAVRKAVDDILYDLYGEENPRPLEDYENTPDQDMTMGGLTLGKKYSRCNCKRTKNCIRRNTNVRSKEIYPAPLLRRTLAQPATGRV